MSGAVAASRKQSSSTARHLRIDGGGAENSLQRLLYLLSVTEEKWPPFFNTAHATI
jgi:hypothetical protein